MEISKPPESPSPRDDENQQPDEFLPKERDGPGRALKKDGIERPAIFDWMAKMKSR